MTRKIKFVENEFYHIYNRGTDKRDVFLNPQDLSRFLSGMEAFNTLEPIGSLYELSFKDNDKQSSELGGSTSKLVEMICYCLNPNHYHLLLKQISENGISKFMHRIGTSYTMYFNEKNKRSGALFQGRFKAIHVNNNEYLLHLSAYINLNFDVHNEWHGDEKKEKLTSSSWDEYMGLSDEKICDKSVILDQFPGVEGYKDFARDSLESIKDKKKSMEIEDLSGHFLE